MRKSLDILSKDIKKENYTMKEIIIFGIIVPLAFVLFCGFAGWLIW